MMADDSHELSHLIFFQKFKKGVAKRIVYCSRDWGLKGSIIHMSLNVMCMESKAHKLFIFYGLQYKDDYTAPYLPKSPKSAHELLCDLRLDSLYHTTS